MASPHFERLTKQEASSAPPGPVPPGDLVPFDEGVKVSTPKRHKGFTPCVAVAGAKLRSFRGARASFDEGARAKARSRRSVAR